MKYCPKLPFLAYPAASPVNQSFVTITDGVNCLWQQYSSTALLKTANWNTTLPAPLPPYGLGKHSPLCKNTTLTPLTTASWTANVTL